MNVGNSLIYLAYYGTRTIVALSFIAFLFMGNFVDAVSTALIFALMVAPHVLSTRYNIKISFEVDAVIATFIFFSLFLGSLQDYYERFPLFDGILHFHSGILLGIIGFTLVYLLNSQKTEKISLSPEFIALFSVTFSLAIGVLWEVFEYFGDLLLGFNMQESGLPDTMGDLIVNAVGALIVGSIGYVWMRRRKKVPFTSAVLEGYEDIAEQKLTDLKKVLETRHK